ncbi:MULTISPECIES: LytR/AlgR family response regulator transcription factor [Mesonia]|uniref:Sensory transduction protein LytR n=1 Tax=Mesonia oceanica TaxID=2687242 RepID=A0AC61Y6Y9_9FLAO|nr:MULTISPECIES: LytTR family DNA-binding domain-containing protein [Mesonia]MAN28352.1 DNA-binding response regulator [Mesonia sp.]VVV00186.1 Sensory transduction protein LytR [Mesonia oceanica]|tara:strand:- start:15072 stop:15833 length:762 start_codon:yes stop_codon:yes gene_type:complete
MRTIIIEDEKPSARRLERMLEKQDVPVEKLLHSVNDSIQWLLENEQPDLIFLDIQLSDGLSFEIFEEIDIESAIIFTTAYDEYALKAFKLNSVDYLLKPIDEEELEAALKKFKTKFANTNEVTANLSELKKLLGAETSSKTYKKRFTVKVGQHLKMFPVEEIECFYSENKGTYLHTKDNRSYLLETTLESLEDHLNPEKFYRVSRKFFVNINAIEDMVSYTNSRLKVKLNHFNEQEIIVARERVKDFKEWLGN